MTIIDSILVDATDVDKPKLREYLAAREVYSVTDEAFAGGAVGDGVSDASDPIIACVYAAIAQTQAGNSGIFASGSYVGTSPIVWFPSGVWKVTKPITADTAQELAYIQIMGADAIIVASAGVTVFRGVGYSVRFKGLIFRGGARAIHIKTNNIDANRIDIIDCEFHNQTTACVETDNVSSSTLLNIDHCKFWQNETGYVFAFAKGDGITVSNCWIYATCPIAVYNAGGNLVMKNTVGVPGPDLDCWVSNTGTGSVDLDTFRMGGEGTEITLVRNYAAGDYSGDITPNHVILRNCQAYGTGYAIEFYALPNIVRIERCEGFVANDGFFFDAALTSADFVNFTTAGMLDIDRSFASGGAADLLGFANVSTTGDLGIKVFNAMRARDNPGLFPAPEHLRVTDVVGSGGITISDWNVVSTANVGSPTSVADAYGVDNYVITASADAGGIQFKKDTFLDVAAMTYGAFYTLNLVVDFTVSTTCKFSVQIGGSAKQFVLGSGKHVVSVPFCYLNGTGIANATYDGLIITVDLRRSGDVAKFGRHITTKGFALKTKSKLKLEVSGSPGAYTRGIASALDHGYYESDRSDNISIASSSPWGYAYDQGSTSWKSLGNVA